MAKLAPKAPRTCVVCAVLFMGNRRATRCTQCLTEKRKPLKQVVPITKRCGACSEDFQTTRKSVARCPTCIASNRKVRYRVCMGCRTNFVLVDDAHLNCKPCADELGLPQHELSPEQLELLRQEEKRKRFIDTRDAQLVWLARRDKVRPHPGATANTEPKPMTAATLGLSRSNRNQQCAPTTTTTTHTPRLIYPVNPSQATHSLFALTRGRANRHGYNPTT